MFLLNLSLAEFLALFGAISGLVVALYLLDRSRRRQTVATLRFWVASQNLESPRRRRRRIQQPLSLLLQLLSLALLLLALAQLRFGVREGVSRDHVLIVDSSAWMESRAAGRTLMAQARELARAWLHSLPPSDRVMLIRAEALATPVTVFESDRRVVEDVIDSLRPGATALDIEQALQLAVQVQNIHAESAGEVVFVGAGRIAEHQADLSQPAPPNLRVLPVTSEVNNVGLNNIGLRRSAADPDLWEIFVSARNYGTVPRVVPVAMHFAGSPLGTRQLKLPPGAEQAATFELRTRAAGWLEARLLAEDDFPGDDRAVIELPPRRVLRVAVYSEEPHLLRPILVANPNVEAVFHRPAEYAPTPEADVVILDRFRPPVPPATDAIWIEPPGEGYPIGARARVTGLRSARWHPEHPLATGLRTKDLRLESAWVLSDRTGDVAVAEVEEGPVILARPGKPRTVALGFHPARSALRYDLATPLMFANILQWISPEIFHHWELIAGCVGSVTLTLDPDVAPSEVSVVGPDQRPLPFTIQDRSLRFFAGTPGTVRVQAGERETVYSLTLPEVAGARWGIPSGARRGLPAAADHSPASRDVWRLLALLGALGLLVEWLLFGQARFRGPTESWTAGGLKGVRFPVPGFLRKVS